MEVDWTVSTSGPLAGCVEDAMLLYAIMSRGKVMGVQQALVYVSRVRVIRGNRHWGGGQEQGVKGKQAMGV